MISSQNVHQLKTYRGIMVDGIVTEEPNQVRGISTELALPTINHSIVSPIKDVVQEIPAELNFPTFGLTLTVLIESTWSAKRQHLNLKIELDEGVTFNWQSVDKPIERGEKLLLEGTAGINITSLLPRAHFVAATLQSLLILDKLAVLRANQPRFTFNVHFADSIDIVSVFMRRRQLAYQLMVIEKSLNQEFPIPQVISNVERSTVDFVYRAVTERSFAWPFWQEPYPFLANELSRKLLIEMNGADSFAIEVGCFQQVMFGRTLNLGEVKVTIQNAALVNPDNVNRELHQLDGRGFEALIKSLSGTATYEFAGTAHLPKAPWDKRIKKFIELEDKLDENLFQSVNQLAAASLEGLTEQEKAAITEPFTLSEAAFKDPNTEVED